MPKRRNTLAKRVNRLEKVSRPEVKHQTGQSGSFDTVGSVNGTVLLPQQLAEGVGRNQRIGDKVKSRNFRFQAILKMPANPASSTCAVRILVLRSKLTYPDSSDMPNWYEPVDEDKFFVIKDMLTQVSALQARTVDGTSYQTGSTLKKFKINIPTGLRKLQYDGASNQSPLNNEYIIYMLAENQSAEVAYNWSHYYIDN
jgi:hypothetical protein